MCYLNAGIRPKKMTNTTKDMLSIVRMRVVKETILTIKTKPLYKP